MENINKTKIKLKESEERERMKRNKKIGATEAFDRQRISAGMEERGKRLDGAMKSSCKKRRA